MKCRNCGATHNGLVCPVCGHKNLKKARCSVCFTILFPGQDTCPKCGSPTVYRQKHDIQNTHNQFNESYNYKKDAYHYDNDNSKASVMSFASIFDPLRNHPDLRHLSKKNKQQSIPGIVILILLFIAFSIFSTIIFN